ncbi:MAG: glycoside hydrolase family 2 protein [Planctomycetia bacterium]|nr:glycoside hydrolase family 2 protein [Planctomycetia bacterium]
MITHPDQLAAAGPHWLPAKVPGTVAAALSAIGEWKLGQRLEADSHDWWFRTTFRDARQHPDQACHLCFDGLATLAEIWLNGRRLLATDNMFRSYRIDVGSLLQPENQLLLAFRSLDQALAQKRPRPRWKTNLVSHQQLRWHRAALLGRIPGWSPPVPAVGPWRDVRLECGSVIVSDVRLGSTLDGATGTVTVRSRVQTQQRVERATFHVGQHAVVVDELDGTEGTVWQAELHVPNPPLWWPHTHGDQPVFDCSFTFVCNGETFRIMCGAIGFRQIEATQEPRFELTVNGELVYCRGACWTVDNIVTLDGSVESLTRDLTLARDAGVNLLRVGGTMVYESDHFYRLCDELGIMVWQDFMFANMDYPVEDRDFAANIEAEAVEQVVRLAGHPSVVVYCGNSEVEQQAAMLGMPEHVWRNHWFAARLPELCSEYHSGTAYVPSTPSGGVLPFHLRRGVSHYFGVGAYQRSTADLRKDDVAFTTECLGFANIPEQASLDAMAEGGAPAVHHPLWKERTPRDTGAGWDFDDVRDFYLHKLFGVDPVRLRSFDPARYTQLSRVVPGEMMSQAFSEWRGAGSSNRGGLVWFYKDLWPGAGWGILDSNGLPKACYFALRRVWQPRQIVVTDEGLEGLHLHVINETATEFCGSVELVLLKDQHVPVARQAVPCSVAARSRLTLQADTILQGFYDVTYSYRFGPPQHDVAIAALLDDRQEIISEAHYFPNPREPVMLPAAAVNAEAVELDDGSVEVSLRSDRFLQYVSFDIRGFLPDDNYFHLSPLRSKRVRLAPSHRGDVKIKGSVEALNLKEPVRITCRAHCVTTHS